MWSSSFPYYVLNPVLDISGNYKEAIQDSPVCVLKHKYFPRCEVSSTRNTYVKSGTFCKLVQFVQPDRLKEFAQDWIARHVSIFQFSAKIFATSSVHLHSNLNICSDCWVCVDELPALVHIINCLLKVKRALQCVNQGLWGRKMCFFLQKFLLVQ